MAKKDLSTDEKAELALMHVMYFHEQFSQMHPSWTNDMVALMSQWIDAGILPAASKTKIKAEIVADAAMLKEKAKR